MPHGWPRGSTGGAEGIAEVALAASVEREVLDLTVEFWKPEPATMRSVEVIPYFQTLDGAPVPTATDLAMAPSHAAFFVAEGTHEGVGAIDGTGELAPLAKATSALAGLPDAGGIRIAMARERSQIGAARSARAG